MSLFSKAKVNIVSILSREQEMVLLQSKEGFAELGHHPKIVRIP